ncbi:MAG TPA: aminopeptidase [Bacilli bacterium]
MSLLEQNLEKYAALAVHVGVNIQQGQTLVINAPISAAGLIRKIAKKAYEAGARNVHVEWSDDELGLIKYQEAPDEAFAEFPVWKAKGMEEMAENGAAFLTIHAPNPDLLKGISAERVAAANKTHSMAMFKYRSYLMANKACWSIIAFPTAEWARKVFPGEVNPELAISKLWDVIFEVTRIKAEDPVQLWKEHIARLTQTSKYLNDKQYQQLIYKAEGTRLTVDLPKNHIWHGGAAVSDKGIVFSPNMPTEEVFTMPHRNGVNGVVRSTKPLNYSGNVIDGFSLTFVQGEIVHFTAETGYDTLKHLLTADEGARRLGEVALVPHQSPISMTGLIFFNTLFDENASSHLAIGKAYPINLAGGADMTEEELAHHGVNTSLVHVDFMIGSADMNIDGVTPSGEVEPIFRNGNWALPAN